MNFFFKIKHYALPYLKFSSTYNSVPISKDELPNTDYWVTGYSSNIIYKKWKIENGIPLGLYNNAWVGSLQKRTHISALCEYFFALNELGENHKQPLIVEFILENLSEGNNLKTNKDYLFWKTYLYEKNQNYFVHGMGQGQLLSLLVRANLQGYKKDLSIEIEKVLESFKLDFNHENGFVSSDNSLVIQEYPHLYDTYPDVLNGWILGLIGLYDAINAGFGDDEIEIIFKKSLKNLSDKLTFYDYGFWSLYNLPKSYKNIASIHYHDQHIAFSSALGFLTNNAILINFSQKMAKYKKNFFYRFLSFFTKIFANMIKFKRIYKFK